MSNYKNHTPIVALIGQTNAGKSSLLNRFAHQNIAIVAREAGTTRDNVSTKIDDFYLLIDTAGLKNPEDDFEATIQDQITDAIDTADLILLTLDSTKFSDHQDKNIAKLALKSKKPVFLLLNKADRGDHQAPNEFRSLGIPEKQTFSVSATTGQGINDLKTAIKKNLTAQGFKKTPDKSSSDRSIKLALIGRPNVGKSSLFNTLGKKQQAIVSSRQGTTRDINRLKIKYAGREIEILDTAGLRRPGKREVGIEKFSALRTLAAIEEADVCAMLIDATEPHAKLDQSLAGQIVEAGKGIIMVVTKLDLIKPKKVRQSSPDIITPRPSKKSKKVPAENQEETTEITETPETQINHILNQLEYDFNFLPYAPVLLTSAETGQNVTKLFQLTTEIDATRRLEIKTSELNQILNDARLSHPPAGLKNTHPKPKYIVQTDTNPPWFVIHGHDLSLIHWSYKRFLERKIREKYPFIGTPIFLSFKNDK